MSAENPYPEDVKPNVIWFMVDQMRMQAMSIAGDPNVHTPNLDRMARDGIWFKNAVMGFPLCCPARGSMLTGQYPHHCVPGHEYFMPQDMLTVAEPLNEAGYHTAWFGKWHLDGHHEGPSRAAWHHVPPERRGRFKTWLGYDNNNSQWDSWLHGHRDDQQVDLFRMDGHESDVLTDMLLEHVEAHKDEPFFACASLQPPHDPYSAPAEWAGRHNPATLQLRPNVPRGGWIEERARQELAGYYALIEQIDHNVGRVLDKLHELKIHDHTYIVFISDHGDHHGSQGYVRKMTCHEEAIRVPCLIWGGNRWRYRNAGTVDYVFNHVDLAPTTLGLCGIDTPACMEGFDYSAVATQGRWNNKRRELPEPPNEAYLQAVIPTGHGGSIDEPWRGIVTRDGWKYVCAEGQPMMLYDLNNDPYEQSNQAFTAQSRMKRKELNEILRGWIEKTGDSFTLPDYEDNGRPKSIARLQEQYADRWADR